MGHRPSDNAAYKKIAIDIAQGIVSGRYPVGVRLKGRSTLAGMYNVSPETVRKAISLLAQHEVVAVTPGSGIQVVSADQAADFIEKLRGRNDIGDLRRRIQGLMEQRNTIHRELTSSVQELLDATDRFAYMNPLAMLELDITPDCVQKGKTLGELAFWQTTGATVIAIRRGPDVLLSPGPFAQIKEGDKLLIIGSDEAYKATKAFMYPEKE